MKKLESIKIIIQGVTCTLPPIPEHSKISFHDLPKAEQKWQRTEIPFNQNEINDWAFISDKIDTGLPLTDKEKNLQTKVLNFVEQEFEKFDKGIYIYINGTPTYIPGCYYYYLQYWVLEDGARPMYRDTDQRFSIFYETIRNSKYYLGILVGKRRRGGYTSFECAMLVFRATTKYNSRCGLISKTGIDAQKAFTEMIVYGFKSLPFFLQPRTDGTDDPKKMLSFVKPASRRKKAGLVVNRREGLNSSVEWRNTALNSFDSGRYDEILIDEGAKWLDVDIYRYWQIVRKTLEKGAIKLGFTLIPSTVNPPKQGGENFQKLWNSSKIQDFPNGETPTRLVTYLEPAYNGYFGFIDDYGNSQPEPAKVHILAERARMQDEEEVLEDTRQLPFNEKDMFSFFTLHCEFNRTRLENRIEYLEKNPEFLRRIRLFESNSTNDIEFMDDLNAGWLLYEQPIENNKVTKYDDYLIPNNTHSYCIGVDPKRLNQESGSYAVIVVFKKSHIVNSKEEGMMPVAIWKGKPRLKAFLHEEVYKACLWYGCKATFEMDAEDDYRQFFLEKKAINLIGTTPDIAIDPKKKKAVEQGVKSANPFQLAKQLEVAKLYVDGNSHIAYNGFVDKIVFPELLQQLLEYDHKDRTKSDIVIALMMALLAAMGQTKKVDNERFKQPLLRTYLVRA